MVRRKTHRPGQVSAPPHHDCRAAIWRPVYEQTAHPALRNTSALDSRYRRSCTYIMHGTVRVKTLRGSTKYNALGLDQIKSDEL